MVEGSRIIIREKEYATKVSLRERERGRVFEKTEKIETERADNDTEIRLIEESFT